MKRFAVLTLALLALTLPYAAQAQVAERQNWGSFLSFKPVYMRNTNAPTGSVARNPYWNASSYVGGTTTGFADSAFFRRGAATATLYDTTGVVATASIPLPPIYGPGFGAALNDSTLPWFILRVSQDSTAYGGVAAASSSLDSVRVAVEWSVNGIDWNAMAGTPTYRFDTVYLTSGADGTQNPTLVGVELLNSYDTVDIPFKCRMSTVNGAGLIVNTQACEVPLIRFIVGMDATGQFKVEMGTWANLDVLN
jgi:hypothetical protein